MYTSSQDNQFAAWIPTHCTHHYEHLVLLQQAKKAMSTLVKTYNGRKPARSSRTPDNTLSPPACGNLHIGFFFV